MRIALLALLAAHAALAQETYAGSPSLDALIEQAIKEELIPGAVLVVGHEGKTDHRKAYGSRALVPSREPMTVDTIFDAASLTKVVATTSAAAKLFEEGKLRLNDPVTAYLPEFQGGRSSITVRHLLTHFSGLRPFFELADHAGYAEGLRHALTEPPQAQPGERFIYSDINFMLVCEIVQRISGQKMDVYLRDKVFGPLGMKQTMFNPPASLRAQIAPTEVDSKTGRPWRGVVHDERARAMGGVTGHAGLFTNAADLERFARMLLAGGKPVFSPLTVRKFTTPETPADQPILRGFGWDIDSPYSGNRGELFPLGSFGHTGFTGTSVWMDPATKSYVILLANSVHPNRGKNLTALRAKVATTAAAALGIDAPGVALTGYNETMVGAGVRRAVARTVQVLTGLDVLDTQKFEPLIGKRIGLITNHSGLDRLGRRNVDVMRKSGVNIVAIFSPEHGISGTLDIANVADAKDEATLIPIISLYQGDKRRMTPEMLDMADEFVFDIQDVGARFYTYSCTMLYALEDAAKARKTFWVLDRPNPITGVKVEGPILDKDLHSFIGCYEMPLRHGLTFGELAKMANAEQKWNADLKVIPMKNWQRGDWFDSTGLTWVDPSPNMRSLNAAMLYEGVAMLEASRNYSVGRGTDAPFEQVGAEFINGRQLSEYLNRRMIPGVRTYPTRFRPTASVAKDKWIEGVRFVITDREALDATRLGLEIAVALQKLWPKAIDYEACRHLIGNREVLEAIKAGDDPRAIQQRMEDPLRAWVERRKAHLLY